MVLSVLLVLDHGFGKEGIVVISMLQRERPVEGSSGQLKVAQALLGNRWGATTPKAAMEICWEL